MTRGDSISGGEVLREGYERNHASKKGKGGLCERGGACREPGEKECYGRVRGEHGGGRRLTSRREVCGRSSKKWTDRGGREKGRGKKRGRTWLY